MKLVQETVVSNTTDYAANDVNLIDPNQLKSKLVDSGLSTRIYALLSNVERIRAFLLKSDDINILICFLGNLCSLSALDLNSLKLNLEKFIVKTCS